MHRSRGGAEQWERLMTKLKKSSEPSSRGFVAHKILDAVASLLISTQVRILVTVPILLILALPAWRMQAQDLHKNMCYRITLSEPVYWATSGVWFEDQGEISLLVVDVLKDQILKIRSNGEVARGALPFEAERPSQVRSAGGDFLLEDKAVNEIVYLDRHLNLTGSTRTRNRIFALDSLLVYDRPLIEDGPSSLDDAQESDNFLHSAMLYSQDRGVARAAPARSSAHGTSEELPVRRRSQTAYFDGEYDAHETFGLSVGPRLPLRSSGIEPVPGNRAVRLMAVHDWSPMGDGILAFGDLESPQEGFQRAFVYFDDKGGHQIFYRDATTARASDPNRLLTMRYIATLDDVGYILSPDGGPTIGEVRLGIGGVRELGLLPEGFRDRPRLKGPRDWSEPRQMTNFYKTLEQSTMAEGLHSWDGSLFLVAKRAAAARGETVRWLIRLDPQDGKEMSRVRLPTVATHLGVVPGDFWALIEKGPVQGIGASHAPYMETSSIVLMPSGWLGRSDRDRLDEEPNVACETISS